MKIQLKDVRLSYPELFEPGKRFGKFSAQFRFNKSSKIKEQIEEAIDEQGAAAFGARWPTVKKSLVAKRKYLSIQDGKEKGYEEDYAISVNSKIRPLVVDRGANPVAASDNVIYPGCRVNVSLDISAYDHKEFGPVVSTKLLGVQFKGDDEPLAGGPVADVADFDVITDGADAEDLI